jgi:hypothetical protein
VSLNSAIESVADYDPKRKSRQFVGLGERHSLVSLAGLRGENRRG